MNININILTHDINDFDKILIHIHGLGSHFQPVYDCMDDFSQRCNILCQHKIKSYAIELRGHGLSDGLRCHIDSFDEYIEDVNTLINYLEMEYNNIPIFILGESMGGAVGIKYCITHPDIIKGIILFAPMCGMAINNTIPWWKANILISLSYIWPTWQYIKINHNYDNTKYIVMKNTCIYRYNDNLRLALGRECYYTMKYIDNNKNKFTTPFIIFHSKTDTVTCINTSRKFYNDSTIENKEIVELDSGYHTLLIPQNDNDNVPNEIMNKTIEWINKMS